ncbi:hypothetical protein W97_04802 [Coniosporium apollinis CBS 100218]|uniref:Uncharacterized protein n=1 Tax=Coniosporium apollinis (strain CBS 100218) TaxID=1168221 RepID=R7YUT1_CONA1|nr:uncharacterized protein W97_04802 [Coniosporium apollinis CBS 100218]EON65564.1 hypothetical protein W97_04802 [Coniosporium apollinis CBS 100218]
MTEPEEHDEDLFADLYEGDDTPAKPVQPAAPAAQPLVEPAEPVPSAPPAVKHEEPPQPEEGTQNGQHDYYPKHEQSDVHMNGGWGDGNAHHAGGGSYDDNYGPIGIKEDG